MSEKACIEIEKEERRKQKKKEETLQSLKKRHYRFKSFYPFII